MRVTPDSGSVVTVGPETVGVASCASANEAVARIARDDRTRKTNLVE